MLTFDKIEPVFRYRSFPIQFQTFTSQILDAYSPFFHFRFHFWLPVWDLAESFGVVDDDLRILRENSI